MSFNLDFSGVFGLASSFVNNLFPVFLVPIGISLGLGILSYITGAFRKML